MLERLAKDKTMFSYHLLEQLGTLIYSHYLNQTLEQQGISEKPITHTVKKI